MKDLKKAALYALIAILAGSATTHQASAQQDVITTVAGGGPSGMPAVNANLNQPNSIAFDSQGNYYITAFGQNRVFKVTSTGTLTVIAGTGIAGDSGDGAAAINAELNAPSSVAVDNSTPADVYVSEYSGCVVRKIDQATGMISTIAGVAGKCSFSGDGGPAKDATVNAPKGVAINSKTGDLYIADYSNGRIRKIAGGAATGTITTIAGGGGSTTAANNCVGSSPYGDGAAASDAYLCNPQRVAVDTSVTPANIFVDEAWPNRCTAREVVGSSNKIYLVAGTYGSCGSTNSGTATSGKLYDPFQLSVSVAGSTTTVAVADYLANEIRQFTLNYSGGVPQPGPLTTLVGTGSASFCGDGGKAASACLNGPAGVTYDSSGNMFIADDLNNRLRKVTKSTGDISTVAGWGYPVGTVTTSVINYSDPFGISDAPATGLSLYEPGSVSVDPASTNVYIAGFQTPAVYKFGASTGIATNVAGNGIPGFAGDGSAGNGATTELYYPIDAAADSSGNVYIADQEKCVIREVLAATGEITTIAGGSEGHPNGCGFSGDGGAATKAQLNQPDAVMLDSNDNLYIADGANCVVRKVVLGSGTITTVAGTHKCGYDGDGGLATAEELNGPVALGIDAAGDLFISDQLNHRIRRVDSVFGLMTTVAGDGSPGYTGDGVATANSLYNPAGAFADANGNLFIADRDNNIVRWVDPAGTLITYAGEPAKAGFSGDGGIATTALLSSPRRVARDSSGNTYFADLYNGRIRKVTPFAGYGRSTAELDFSKQQIGTTSEFQPITLSAIGPVTISKLTLPAGFAETDDCINNDLSTGDTCEIDVTFTPTKGGITKGALTITSNAYFNGTNGLSAQGNTVDLVGEGGGLSITGSLAFPTQLVGATSTQTVTLANTGNAVKLASIGVPGASSFSVTGGTCKAGNTLAANASCTIAVTFKASSTGNKKDALAVTSNDPASPLLANVDRHSYPAHVVSPPRLPSGTLTDGTTKTLNLTITNSNGSFTITTNYCPAQDSPSSPPAIPAAPPLQLARNAPCPSSSPPTAVQAYSGTLTLVSSDPTGPLRRPHRNRQGQHRQTPGQSGSSPPPRRRSPRHSIPPLTARR